MSCSGCDLNIVLCYMCTYTQMYVYIPILYMPASIFMYVGLEVGSLGGGNHFDYVMLSLESFWESKS